MHGIQMVHVPPGATKAELRVPGTANKHFTNWLGEYHFIQTKIFKNSDYIQTKMPAYIERKDWVIWEE